MQQSAVKKDCRYKSPRLADVVGQWERFAQSKVDLIGDCAKSHQAATESFAPRNFHCDYKGQRIHHAADCQNHVSYRRSLWHPAAERPACGGHGKRHACSALMAFVGRCAHQCPAGRAKARAQGLWLGVKHLSNLAAPAVQFVAPSNGKWHVVSLLEKNRMPIIAGIARGREIRRLRVSHSLRFPGSPGGTRYRSPLRKRRENVEAYTTSPSRVCVRTWFWFV